MKVFFSQIFKSASSFALFIVIPFFGATYADEPICLSGVCIGMSVTELQKVGINWDKAEVSKHSYNTNKEILKKGNIDDIYDQLYLKVTNSDAKNNLLPYIFGKGKLYSLFDSQSLPYLKYIEVCGYDFIRYSPTFHGYFKSTSGYKTKVTLAPYLENGTTVYKVYEIARSYPIIYPGEDPREEAKAVKIYKALKNKYPNLSYQHLSGGGRYNDPIPDSEYRTNIYLSYQSMNISDRSTLLLTLESKEDNYWKTHFPKGKTSPFSARDICMKPADSVSID